MTNIIFLKVIVKTKENYGDMNDMDYLEEHMVYDAYLVYSTQNNINKKIKINYKHTTRKEMKSIFHTSYMMLHIYSRHKAH